MAYLFLALVVAPLVELYLLFQVAELIGFWPTVGITVVTALVGSHLAKKEGHRVWRAWSQSLQELRSPAEGILEGALILVGGTLLLTPGLITDALGFALLLPWTRRALLGPLSRAAQRKIGRVRVRREHTTAYTGGPYRDERGPTVVDTTSEPVSSEGSEPIGGSRPQLLRGRSTEPS